MEIYIASSDAEDDTTKGITVYSGGTLVAESFLNLAALNLNQSLWTDRRLTGMVDFPGFRVTPGNRRQVILDAAASAFARAMTALEPLIQGVLEKLDRDRRKQLDRGLIRDLQRAFKDFYKHRPNYTLLPVHGRHDGGGGSASRDASTGSIEAQAAPRTGADPGVHDLPEDRGTQADLMPPGPMASLQLTPDPLRVECRGVRRIRARPRDTSGRVIEQGVRFRWQLDGPVGMLVVDADRSDLASLTASHDPATGVLAVDAFENDGHQRAKLVVEVVDILEPTSGGEGIPDPEFVHEPGASWCSRMQEKRWQVNSGHRDYRDLVDEPALKLRYLAMLFAKEVVLRSHHDPRLESPLEQLVEVAGYADRNLAARRPRRRKPPAGK